LLQKSLERGWNVVVQVGAQVITDEMDEKASDRDKNQTLKFLDKALWTFRDDSFLPHAVYDETIEQIPTDEELAIVFEEQPILLCSGDQNPNNAQVRFYVSGAVPSGEGDYQRLVFMFDGHDPDAVIAARSAWKNLSKSHEATYWQQQTGGNWVKKA